MQHMDYMRPDRHFAEDKIEITGVRHDIGICKKGLGMEFRGVYQFIFHPRTSANVRSRMTGFRLYRWTGFINPPPLWERHGFDSASDSRPLWRQTG